MHEWDDQNIQMNQVAEPATNYASFYKISFQLQYGLILIWWINIYHLKTHLFYFHFYVT